MNRDSWMTRHLPLRSLRSPSLSKISARWVWGTFGGLFGRSGFQNRPCQIAFKFGETETGIMQLAGAGFETQLPNGPQLDASRAALGLWRQSQPELA